MRITVTGVKRLERQLDPKLLQLALKRGLERTTTTAVKEASQAVRAIYNIKARDVKDNLRVKKPTVRDLVVTIYMSSKPIPLFAFGGRRIKVRKKPRNSSRTRTYYGASAKILRKGKRVKYKGAFIASKGAKTGIFKRKGAARLPIVEKRVISPTTMFRKYGVDRIEEVFNRVFEERVMADYRYRISKAGGA